VRDRLREEQADPLRHPDRAHQAAVAEVRRHNDYALARGLEFVDDEGAAVRDVLARVTGYGPLQLLLDDPEVEEIWINGPGAVFAARAGRSERVPMRLSDEAVRDLVEKMLHATGRRVDLSQPFVDASLPDGSRLHVVIPDITRSHLAVNIRKFLPARRSLDDLVGAGSLPAHVADMLRDAMVEGRNVLVSGATHAGKTTMLAALIGACRPSSGSSRSRRPSNWRSRLPTSSPCRGASRVWRGRAREPASPREGGAAHAPRSPDRRGGP
jgi:pilus assembly protein CpaF